MRALLVGHDLAPIERAAREAGIEITDDGAEVCICFGGDGTLLGAERDYPGLPKVPIRRRHLDPAPAHADYVALFRRVAARQSPASRLVKLEAQFGAFQLLALNDIVVHNADMVAAVRYRVEIDGMEHVGEVVGDGLVVSTPFGSSAYYRAITDSVIHVGIGLAFNNSTEPVNHLVLAPQSRIKVRITRGPALLAADNNPMTIPLSEGDVIEIRQAQQEAEIWEIDDFLRMDRADPETGRRLRWLGTFAAKA